MHPSKIFGHDSIYEEIRGLATQLAEQGTEITAAKASEHMFEMTFKTDGDEATVKLTASAALRTSDFAPMEEVIDDDLIYIDYEDGRQNMQNLFNGTGTASIDIKGNGFRGTVPDETAPDPAIWFTKHGSVWPTVSSLMVEYDGILTPYDLGIDEYDLLFFDEMKENGLYKFPEEIGKVSYSKFDFKYDVPTSAVYNTNHEALYSGESDTIEFELTDYFGEPTYAMRDWLTLAEIVNSYEEIDESLITFARVTAGCDYEYFESAPFSEGGHGRAIKHIDFSIKYTYNLNNA